MKRPLLFRVWDKFRKQYFYPDKGYQGHFYLTLDGQFMNLQNGSGGDEYVVQQFTGLDDKKGEKIYEGDIVLLNKGKPYQHKYKVVYNLDRFLLISDESDDYGPYRKDLAATIHPDNPIVIGNIFEGLKHVKPKEEAILFKCLDCGRIGWDGYCCRFCGKIFTDYY